MDHLPDTQHEPIIEEDSKLDEDDALDPRIQIELERLNYASEAINQLEVQLDEARRVCDEFKEKSEEELFQLEKKIGEAVSKARTYYDARIKLRDAKEKLIKAKHRFERAQALHVAAKEIAIASADYMDEAARSHQNSTTWNETYLQASAKAKEAEQEKYEADLDQQNAERVHFDLEQLVLKLQKESRRAINKSKPYYEMKVEYHKELDFQKRKVRGLENCVNEAKSQYQESLKNLERISNEIHEKRHQKALQNESEEKISDKQSLSTPVSTNNPTVSMRKNHLDGMLRTCLLRTETLPAGVFANTNDRNPPEYDKTRRRTDDFNNQFILCPKGAPCPNNLINPEQEAKALLDSARDRLPSYSSYVSQSTDDEDEKTASYNIISDEQLDHLTSLYNSFSSESSTPTGTHDQLHEHTHNIISKSLLY
ncbi:unnamed protein product [Rotaria sp. Silwood1]|nr:unnamed protein product [Rotaria sp. Silwood1]CAF3598947.1 unnamed protein product [Rotaria sp. Silwood1]CAF4627768.1 unnamed protein product [Rotaria sp. Silwood1]